MTDSAADPAQPIRIVQLFPDELSVTGDNGNLAALQVRMQRAGLTTELTRLHRSQAGAAVVPELEDPDLIVIGNGPWAAMEAVHDALITIAPALRDRAEAGVAFFAVGAGAELLGERIELDDGNSIQGAGVLPLTAIRGRRRRVGYIVLEASVDGEPTQLVGFEDHATDWVLGAGAVPLGTVVKGGGNGSNQTEGLVHDASIATHVQGPVLPLNPALADALIRMASVRRGLEYLPGAAHAELDRLARKSRETILANLHQVFTSI
ncbi:MAG: glutamine amidotransferase [Microbacteriaceae bacterium]